MADSAPGAPMRAATNRRVFGGMLAASVAAVATMAAAGLVLYPRSFSDAVGTVVLSMVAGVPVALLVSVGVGLPLLTWLERKGRATRGHVVLLGAGLGAVAMGAFAVLGDAGGLAEALGVGGAMGVVGGYTFARVYASTAGKRTGAV